MKNITLSEALERYVSHHVISGSSDRTIETVKDRIGRFIRVQGNIPLRDVTEENIALHFRYLKERGLAESTLAGHRAFLRAFFKHCKKKKWIKKNPASVLKNRQYSYSFDPVVRRPANEKDFHAVIRAIPAFLKRRGYHRVDVRDALVVSLAIDTSARRGEIWALNRVDMIRSLAEGENCVYHIHSYGKTKGVKLRFFEETATIARMWIDRYLHKDATWVFENPKTGARYRADYLGDSFERLCAFADVPVFRFQATRKRGIMDMIKVSGDPKVGQMHANHARSTTTQTYYNLIEDEAVDKAASKRADQLRGNSVGHDDISKLFGVDREK